MQKIKKKDIKLDEISIRHELSGSESISPIKEIHSKRHENHDTEHKFFHIIMDKREDKKGLHNLVIASNKRHFTESRLTPRR